MKPNGTASSGHRALAARSLELVKRLSVTAFATPATDALKEPTSAQCFNLNPLAPCRSPKDHLAGPTAMVAWGPGVAGLYGPVLIPGCLMGRLVPVGLVRVS